MKEINVLMVQIRTFTSISLTHAVKNFAQFDLSSQIQSAANDEAIYWEGWIISYTAEKSLKFWGILRFWTLH